jgi:ADP-heptose:LPS heptosyltransferase
MGPAVDAERIAAEMGMIDWTAELPDYADTAALVANLDLVISVDSSVAHVAGAMGGPVWMLTPISNEWRWMIEGEGTPWYPTMRVFRQDRLGDWSGTIDRLVEALRTLVQERAA